MSQKDLTAFIFARGGSKGVKNKNIRDVGGKPLIAHAIKCGLDSKYIARVVVSTDSEEIANVARKFGAEVVMRPSELASDTAAEILSWRHAIEAVEGTEVFVSIPATSPLRAPSDLDQAVERFRKGDCDVVFGISPSARNPYLNMVTIDEADHLKIAISGSAAVRRQDVPEIYDVTTCVYVSSAKYVQSCSRLMDGKVGYVKIPPSRALDIDEEFDLYLADLMLTHPFKGNI